MADFQEEFKKAGNSTLGYTTTVKDQVQNIELTIQHFKKSIDLQRKSQSQVHFQLQKLEELTHIRYDELEKQINDRINYLSESFKKNHAAQEKQLDYLELQNSTLSDEHKKLIQLGEVLQGRIEKTEANVGI